MKLTAAELAYVGSQGLYITEKCDGCGKLLNQTVRHTITGKPGVYCSAECRDFAFFGYHRGARKRSTPLATCQQCGHPLRDKRDGAGFCSIACKSRFYRTAGKTQKRGNNRIAEPMESMT